jgi:hypothetical protein
MTQTALHTESWSIRKSTCASSRRINGFAEHNVQAVAFCENQAPDFIVIADFVSGMADEIKQVFINILLIVDQMNLPGNTVFALDGCKLLSNAGKEQTGRSDTLSRSRCSPEAQKLFIQNLLHFKGGLCRLSAGVIIRCLLLQTNRTLLHR